MSKVPADALLLVEHFEGRRLRPYLCSAGVWTIGVGATRDLAGEPVTQATPPITDEEADALLERDLRESVEAVDRNARAPLSEGERAALVSWVFNLGETKFRGSTLLKRIQLGDMEGAAEALEWWNKAGGVIVPGLVRRRETERLVFQGWGAIEAIAEGRRRAIDRGDRA